MANIPKVDGNFELEVNNATQSYEDTLYTDNKNISGNIHIHITAKSGVLNNTPTSGITYTEDTSQQSVLPSEGALYLNEGYYQNTKITLDHMLPDPSGTYTNPGTNDIRAGRKAYDGSGKLIVGTMADVTPSFSGGTPSLTNTTNTITTNMATASSGTYKINAVAKAKATRTKVSYNNDYTGYLDKASGTEASAATTSAEGSINAVTIYIKSCTITNNTSGGSSSGTINRGSQIKIGQGYNPSDVYYTAQANSGTKTITANGVESCDGYASVDVQVPTGITPTGTITLTQQTGTNVTNYASANVRGATYGATLAQSAVSNHQVVITPSVSVSQSGWVGSGKTGTSITVKASDLVSGTYTVTGSGSADVTNYENVNVPSGNVGQSSSIIAASSVSLDGDVVRLQANVTPVVHTPGWVTVGTAEPVILQATITLPTFKKVEVTASSTQIYKVLGTVIIKAVNSEEGTGVTLTDTYFKITSITTGVYQSGTYVTTVTYQTMATNTGTSGDTDELEPGWNTAATTVAYGNKSSGGKCILQFECGQATVAKCSSNSTQRSLSIYGSITSGTTYYRPIYGGQMQNELCWFYFDTHFSASSTYRRKCVFAKYVEISHDQNNQPSGTYSRSTRTIHYRYSSNGSSWTTDSCSATNSSSGQASGNAYYYCCYYATTEYL